MSMVDGEEQDNLDPANALLRAVYQQLSNDADLQLLIGDDAIVDRLKPRPNFPCIVIGELEQKIQDLADGCVIEAFFKLEIWPEGDGKKQALQISTIVAALLTSQPLILNANAHLISLQLQSCTIKREGKQAQQVAHMRFRAFIDMTSTN